MKKSHGLKFIKNYAYNHIGPSVKRPTYAYLTITSLCNSRCNYCGMWKNKKENEPTTEEWKRIINDVAKIGAVTLTFSGGEPFLRSDLFELASHAKLQGLVPMVVTNLSLFNKDHVAKIAENFDFIGISLDTIHPEMYNEIRGKDWLEQIKQNIHVLMDGLSMLKSETEVSAVVTVSNRNADEIHELIHMVFDELNMDTITFNLLDPNGGPKAKEFIPTQEQLQYFKQVVLDHKSLYPISNSTRYFNQLGHFDYACNPWKCVQIDHRGFLMTPCLFLHDHQINLREQRLSDVWKSKHIQKMYSQYNNCKTCNLGCVAESAWSTSDINFIINEGFRGIIIPTIKRIRVRNE
jgi:MoaA/NifB/PqqE/SkfB family radical SAM enzyme